jgi:hypothetical protein
MNLQSTAKHAEITGGVTVVDSIVCLALQASQTVR